MTDRSTADDPAASRPYYRLLGLRTEPGQPAGTSLVRFESRRDFENSRGDVHGGVVASLLDAVMGNAVRSMLGPNDGATTVSLTVNYLEPGRSVLIATGRVIRKGRSLASVEGRIEDSSGRVVAHGVATMRIIAARE